MLNRLQELRFQSTEFRRPLFLTEFGAQGVASPRYAVVQNALVAKHNEAAL